MAKHQIIYTSCMRGIDGVNDGQQIFSYDEGFVAAKADEVKSLFTYQVPALPPGVLMSEEVALTMPAAFSYRLLKNGNAAISLNTYLGRDYMGSAGRFGNHLSHSIVCDFEDFDVYPSELYYSTTLRSEMKYEEVNNPEPPAYLPTPKLEKGDLINPDSISDFLGIADNMERFKQMVVAMFKFQTERKRIVICDEPENIAKWIAALHYVLPLEIAKKINFTTYEFDPELSPAQICGVVSEGTKYQVGNYMASNRHYVFDFLNNQFSSINVENDMMDFLETSFSFSYGSLIDFHDFILRYTLYRKCDEQYYIAYYLYNLVYEGIGEVSKEQFEEVIDFSSEYLSSEVKRKLIYELLNKKDSIRALPNDYALSVLGYILRFLPNLDSTQQDLIKQMIVDRLILSLSTEDVDESKFLRLFDNIDGLARSINLSIPAELMIVDNRKSLLSVISQGSDLWKVNFVVRIISDYVKDLKLSIDELYPDRAIGAIYFGVVDSVYRTGRKNGFIVVEKILEGFKNDLNYFVNMVLNLEGFLKDLNLEELDVKHLWEIFYHEVSKMDDISLEEVHEKLAEYNRFDEMYLLYKAQMTNYQKVYDVRNYFENYWKRWFIPGGEYTRLYGESAVKVYAENCQRTFSTVSEKEKIQYMSDILDLAIQMKVIDENIIEFIQNIIEYIPMEKVEKGNELLINKLSQYTYDVLKRPIEDKLLLLVILLELNNITKKEDIALKINKIKVFSIGKSANFGRLKDGTIKEYFEYAFDRISDFNLTEKEYILIYTLFDLEPSEQLTFMQYWCKVSYTASKGKQGYVDFAEYLKFMFQLGSKHNQEMVGKYLCSLSKSKLEELNKEMLSTHFQKNTKQAELWLEVKEIANNTNPLLNKLSNLGNLFKKK